MPYTPRVLYQIQSSLVLDQSQTPETVTESRWHQPWSEPVRTKPRAPHFQDYFAPPAVVVSFGWMAALSEPVRYKQFDRALNWWEFKPGQNIIPAFGYYQPLAEPVRFKQFDRSLNQWELEQPFPIINISWFNWLAEPKRFKPIAPHFEPFFYHPNPVISIGWFDALAEPVRYKVIPTANIEFPTPIIPSVPFVPGPKVPLFYQQPIGSFASSGFWKGRGVQK